jgi:DNA-binding MarR family transcriptional regulator
MTKKHTTSNNASDANSISKNKVDKNPSRPEIAIPGEFAYEGLDRVMHEKARLGILTSLMNWPEGLAFGDLRSLCALTDGNLNRHLQALNEAGLIEINKGQRDNYPQTLVKITKSGRTRFAEYLQELERVIANAALAQSKSATQIAKPSKSISRLSPRTT